MTVTRQEKYDCAKREVRQRRKVFPRLIEQGKMSAEFAARQIEIMEAIAKDYEEPPSPDRWKERSRTFPGIAEAMADQWGGYAMEVAA